MSGFTTKKEVKNKIDLGAKVASYPMPVTLIGANVMEKANFLAAAWFMAAAISPPKVTAALGKAHYTNQGIKENKTFSVCIPSEDMVKATDYCGLVSGFKADKSEVFDVFYGKLKTAPMISECPVNLECSLDKVIDNVSHDIFIGEIVSTYTEEKYLTAGVVDIKKIKPLMLSLNDRLYYALGEPKAKAWESGKNYKS
ncbi:MAG: flavin reductase family protein [Candidatus Bathyarchaeia archaeon]|jgi:flavin reductase (DIM6/NTAB) family NADH-FMN oxidoreductase RutF